LHSSWGSAPSPQRDKRRSGIQLSRWGGRMATAATRPKTTRRATRPSWPAARAPMPARFRVIASARFPRRQPRAQPRRGICLKFGTLVRIVRRERANTTPLSTLSLSIDPLNEKYANYGAQSDVFPDYETGWTEAGCMNNGPLPSGRPIYESQLQCCRGACESRGIPTGL